MEFGRQKKKLATPACSIFVDMGGGDFGVLAKDIMSYSFNFCFVKGFRPGYISNL